MSDKEKLFELIKTYLSGSSSISENSDIQYDLGIYGDDALDLLKEYSQSFEVDISNFDFNRYFKSEGELFFPKFEKALSRKGSKLKSISVKDLLVGIERRVL
jgi:hypothetical protein